VRERRKIRVLKGFFTNIKAKVLEGFSWVISRVGVTIVTPWKYLLIKSLGHMKRFEKMIELG
jgi:hypothetical protein